MAKDRQDYIEQRVPQIVDQMIAALAKPVVELKSKGSYIRNRLSALSGPQYENYLFRRLTSLFEKSEYFEKKNALLDDDDEDENRSRTAYFIKGEKFKTDIENFAKNLAEIEYDKRTQNNADVNYDGLQDFLSLWDKIGREVEQSVSAADNKFKGLKTEVETYVNEHAPQMKGELLSRLAPGGKLMLTAGWAAGLDKKQVERYLKNVKNALGKYQEKATNSKLKTPAIKKMKSAIDSAMEAGASAKFESRGFGKIYDDFVREVAELEGKMGMMLVTGKQPHFLTSFDINFKTAEKDCDALGWKNGNISKEDYVKWKAGAYRFTLLKAIGGSDIYAKKGLPHRLKALRELKNSVYEHESWGKLLDAFEKAVYKDFRHNKRAQMLQQVVLDDNLSAALDAFAKHAADSEYDLRKADSLEAKEGVLYACKKVVKESDEDFNCDMRDIENGAIFDEKKDEAAAYVKERKPAVKKEFSKRFVDLFNEDLIGSDEALTNSEKQEYAMFRENLADLQGRLLPVSKSFDAEWAGVCGRLIEACETLSSGKKLSEEYADVISQDYGRMMEMLAGYEYWQKELSMGAVVPDSSTLVLAAFGEPVNKEAGRRQGANKYRDPNYDWSKERDEENAYVAERSVSIEECLKRLFGRGLKSVTQGQRQEFVSYIRKAFLEPKANPTSSDDIHSEVLSFAAEEWKKLCDILAKEPADEQEINFHQGVEDQDFLERAIKTLANKMASYEFRAQKKMTLKNEYNIESYLTEFGQGMEKVKKRLTYMAALRGLFSFNDAVIDGSIPEVNLVYHIQRTLSQLFSEYANRSNPDSMNLVQSEMVSDVLMDIEMLARALKLQFDRNDPDNRPEEESKRMFEKALADLAEDLLKLDDEVGVGSLDQEDLYKGVNLDKNPDELEESAVDKEDFINVLNRLDELDEPLEEGPIFKMNPSGAGKIFADISRITRSVNENMENFRSIELAVNIILNTADNLDEAVEDLEKMFKIPKELDVIGFEFVLYDCQNDPGQIPQMLHERLVKAVRDEGLVVDYYHEIDYQKKWTTSLTNQICELADYYMHRRSEPNRQKPKHKEYSLKTEAYEGWKERLKNLAEEYVASREYEAIAWLDTGLSGMDDMWEAKAYSKNFADPTKNDEAFNKMELAYDRFRSIAKALCRKKAKSEDFTPEEKDLFKKNRNALLLSAESFLSQMGDERGNGNNLLSGRRELAAFIKKELNKFTNAALEKQLLIPVQQKPQAHQPDGSQQVNVNRQEEEAIGNDFEQLDYHALFQNYNSRVDQYMSFFMQRYGITSDEISLILGKGAKKGKESAQAYTVLYDIIARNQIPSDIIPEDRIVNFVTKTCKKIRQKKDKASMTPENRLMFAEGLAGLFSTSEFDKDRDYEQQPLTDQEKSGYHAKMTLYNYFHYLDEDHYNPDAWYKSVKFSDIVGEWSHCRKRGWCEGDRISPLIDLIDQKWKFGEELSEVLARQIDKAFCSVQEKEGLNVNDENFEKDMKNKVKDKYFSSLYMFKCMVNEIPSQKFADFNIELPPEIHDNVFLSPLSSFTLKVNYRPVPTDQRLGTLQSLITQEGGEKVESRLKAVEDVRLLLQNVEEFDLNLSMLSTRKLLRVFNWNSSEYNHCLSSLEQLRNKRDTVLRQIAELRLLEDLNWVEDGFLLRLDDMLRELNDQQRICAQAVEAYNNKVYIENVRDKKQSAGMARFAGAQGMAKLLRNADGMLLSQKQTFRAQDQAGQEQLQKFQSAYKMEQEKRQAFGMDAVHRGAANKAKATLQE